MRLNSARIIGFSDLGKHDLELVGKKAVELSELTRLGIPIPDGFVITTAFFEEFLNATGILKEIDEIRKIYHPAIQDSMPKLFEPVKKKIVLTHLPQDLSFELHKFYRKLSGLFKEPSLNIFTSPLKGKSIQFLDIKGDANLVLKIKEIWAEHLENPTPIIIQKNINSKNKGKILTNDPLINNQNLLTIARKIQNHFYFPQELDYVIEKGKIYITQIRPFSGKVEKSNKVISQNKKVKSVLIRGISINPGIVTGPVKVLRENHDLVKVKSEQIIVLSRLDMSLYEKIKKAKAIVVDTTLTSSYHKMIYRKDFKMPTIEGAKSATKILQNGNIITVNGMSGEIYSGGFI